MPGDFIKEMEKEGIDRHSLTNLALSILKPKLWSPANPYLYQLVTTIFENGKKIDELKKKIKEDEEQMAEWTKIIGSEKLRRNSYINELESIKL